MAGGMLKGPCPVRREVETRFDPTGIRDRLLDRALG
jgi:hypothetical protein